MLLLHKKNLAHQFPNNYDWIIGQGRQNLSHKWIWGPCIQIVQEPANCYQTRNRTIKFTRKLDTPKEVKRVNQ